MSQSTSASNASKGGESSGPAGVSGQARVIRGRRVAVEVDAAFPDRWSPRAFDPAPLQPAQVWALLEAARWAPSAYNEQPWRFVYAVDAADRRRLLETLMPANQQWAARAPLLLYLVSRRRFTRDGKSNRHFGFDAGAAWMSLALQARRLGLYAHAMAGFRREAAEALLGVDPEKERVMVAIAVGRLGDPAHLPEAARAMEAPNDRKPLSEVTAPLGPGSAEALRSGASGSEA